MNYNFTFPSLSQTTTDPRCLSIFHFYSKFLSFLATTSACLSNLPDRVTQTLASEDSHNLVIVGQENTKRCPVVSSEFHTYSFLPCYVAETLVSSIYGFISRQGDDSS